MNAVLRSIGVILLAAGPLSPAYAGSLRDKLPEATQTAGIQGGQAFDALADAIADTASRTLPIVAASAGFTYRYNADLEIFERTSETLGPIFLERPDTLGRGKFNVNVSFQYVELNEWDGDSLSGLEAPDPIVLRVVDASGNLQRLTANRLRSTQKLINHIAGLSFTYGVLDSLDLNLLLPLIATNYDVTMTNLRLFRADPGGAFEPAPAAQEARGTAHGNSVGVGDILLRAKYQLPRAGGMRPAAGLQFRLPSGDEDDFQGTGSFEVSPFFYASTILWSRVEPHVNLGLDLRADDVEQSQGRYGAGVDVDVTRRVGIALAFLGRSEFKRGSPPGATSFLHLVDPVNSVVAQRPLLGIQFDRKDFFDLSFGARAVVWRQLMVFVNGIYALNDDGLRNDTIIPTFGVEGTF